MALSSYSPADSTTSIAVQTVLAWADSVASDHYEVYFGTSEADVTNKASAAYRGNVTEKTYDPRVTLGYNTAHYWRIIAKKSGSADVDSGVLSFTTLAQAVLPVAKNYRKRLCAAADDKFWYENDDTPPRLIELSGLALDTDTPLSMEEYQQKVYIVNGTIMKVVDFVNTKIAVSGMSNYPTRGSTVSQATTGAQMIVDFVNDAKSAIYGRTITAEAFEQGYQLTGGGMTAVNAGTVTEPTIPHHYDWTTYAEDTDFYGALPSRATILKRFRNRLCLSGNAADPHQWYLLRQDNPYDALYAADDAQSPVAGQDSESGKIGDIVTACIPYGDDYCLWGSVGALWVMRGDPAAGGSLDNLSDTVGIVSKDAWCKDDGKNLYTLSTTGLYKISYPLGKPEALTDEDVIPTFIEDLDLNPENQRITMAYDPMRKGIQLCVTNIQAGTNINYWYDTVTRGFFPETYPDEDSVYSMHFYNADEPDFRRLLIGCADGHIRCFDDAAKSDDNGSLALPSAEAIDSWVLLGPIRISEAVNLYGILNSLTFVTAGGGAGGSIPDSDDIVWGLYVDSTAEGVIEKCDAGVTPFGGVVKAPGRSFQKRLRAKGVFAGIRIGNSTLGQTFGIERVTGQALRFGEVR
jgi:hypothetical protein